MSATILERVQPTKTWGDRPPIVPPRPVGFYPGGSDDDQPMHRRIEASVRVLLKSIERLPWVSVDTNLELIQNRKRLIHQEMDAVRMLSHTLMPPPVHGIDDDWDLADDDEALLNHYSRLLRQLEEAEAELKRRKWLLNQVPHSSD